MLDIFKRLLLCVLCTVLTVSFFRLEIFATADMDVVFTKSREPTKKIALTFDDGPHPRYTERILRVLEKYNVKATFFVIGVNIQNYPEPLKKIYAAGHEVGNHTFHHDNQKDLSSDNALSEMKACEQIIFDTIGTKPTVFRPPRGACNSDVILAAQDLGYSVILWSIDTLDWKGTSSGCIVSTINNNICGGDIVLMHDYTCMNNTTSDALEIVIPKLLSQGYQFVTVSELIK